MDEAESEGNASATSSREKQGRPVLSRSIIQSFIFIASFCVPCVFTQVAITQRRIFYHIIDSCVNGGCKNFLVNWSICKKIVYLLTQGQDQYAKSIPFLPYFWPPCTILQHFTHKFGKSPGGEKRNPPRTRRSELIWWPRPGSNRRHTDFQSVALPTELPSHASVEMVGAQGFEPWTQ